MAYRAEDPAPLLPASVRARLQGGLWKVLGFLMLAACVALSVSLLTWSAADPSLTRATSVGARNLLGPPGAILSDIFMQMLGLAGVFLLLPPLFWGLRLISSEQPPGLRGKLVLAPLAVLFLAAALSALPSAASWPLHHHGYGGVLGDLGLGLLASLLAHVNPDRSAAAAGLFYFAAGLLMLMSSLGLTRQELRLICQTNARSNLRSVASWWQTLYDSAVAFRPATSPPTTPELRREPPALRIEPPVTLARVDEPEPVEEEFDHPGSGRDPSFDRMTDHTSHAIAKRFAPSNTASQAIADGPAVPSLAEPAIVDREQPQQREQRGGGHYRRPPLGLLRRQTSAKAGPGPSQSELHGQAQLLGEVLADFGVKGEIKSVHPGPVVTLHEFEPARGVKSARVVGLADDIARSMGAACVRAAAIPGRNAIGIELPNPRREKVLLRELLDSDTFRASDAALPLALGKNISGTPVFADLARMPHLLVAGTTGSGKSVGVNAMILSLLYRLGPEQCRFLMIDPKMLELSVYNGIPHLLCPVVTDPTKAVAALEWVVAEMEQRYRRMSGLSVRNIEAFNSRARHARDHGGGGTSESDLAAMPYIVVVVDEFADLMLVAGKEIDSAVQRLAQMARAAGIHLIMATQRPSVDIVTGTIKANFPTRISYKVASKFDSRTIVNEQGAEQLLGEGDMLFSGGAGRLMRVHGPFVSDEEVERIVAYMRDQGEPRYVEGITDAVDAYEPTAGPGGRRGQSSVSNLYERAVGIVVEEGKASISYLQRKLAIGYNRAANLIERMEGEGIVGPARLGGRREVLHDADAARDKQW